MPRAKLPKAQSTATRINRINLALDRLADAVGSGGEVMTDAVRNVLQEAQRSLFGSGGFRQWKTDYKNTGRLRASLTGQTTDSVWRVTEKGAKFGTSVPYLAQDARPNWKHDPTEVLVTERSGKLIVAITAEITRLITEAGLKDA